MIPGTMAAIECAREVARSISFADWVIEVDCEPTQWGDVLVIVRAPVLDRDTGQLTMIIGTVTLPTVLLLRAPGEAPELVRSAIVGEIRDLWMHEFDEHLKIDGVRVRDPHAVAS